jgi:transitional endoplasmic reticulum ATPase
VDVDQLVASSALFTPADIEFAAHKGAQTAFEREVVHHQGQPAHTGDYLVAIADTRPTLTDELLTDFDQDNGMYSRL